MKFDRAGQSQFRKNDTHLLPANWSLLIVRLGLVPFLFFVPFVSSDIVFC